jgi:UDP-N-acetylmuramate: L-alanyl-gamma-D-glutamyl-meso-diaminopimelate ligase
LDPEQTLSPARVAEGIRERGGHASTFESTEDIIRHLASEVRAGDHVVIMSNGGFENIHNRLLDKLRGGKA